VAMLGTQEGDMAEDGGDDHQVTGRAAVRRLFVARLAEAGMRRARGASVADHDALMERLVDHLAYMRPECLSVLADAVIGAGGGARRDECPSEVTIRNWAEGLQAKPWEERPIVRSWLASVEGPRAEAGGYLVQLMRHLRKRPVPPTPYDIRQIHAQAGEDQRTIGLIRGRIERGTATDTDRAELRAYLNDEALARDIVDAGKARRAAAEAETRAVAAEGCGAMTGFQAGVR